MSTSDLSSARDGYYSQALDSITKLETAAMSFFTPSVLDNIENKVIPTVSSTFINTLIGSKELPDYQTLTSEFEQVQTTQENSFSDVDNMDYPPKLAEITENPLDYWNGLDITESSLWTNLLEIEKNVWLDPNWDATKKKIIAELADFNATSGYLVPSTLTADAQDRTRSYYAKMKVLIRGNARLRPYCEAELGRRESYNLIDIARWCLVLIEEHTKFYIAQDIGLGLSANEMERKYALSYGHIYATLTGILLDKAKMETDWFFKDYKARMQLYISANEGNYNIYMESVAASVDNIIKQAELDIKGLVADFNNSLIAIRSQYGFDKLDLDRYKSLEGDTYKKFKIDLDTIVRQGIVSMEDYTTKQQTKISIYDALATGYSNLIRSVGTNSMIVYPTKKTS